MYRLGTAQSQEMQFSSVILGICGFTIIFQQMAVKYQEEGVSHISVTYNTAKVTAKLSWMEVVSFCSKF